MQKPKSKSTAIVLAVLLGGVGAHQFYLGDNLKGVLYLLFSPTLVPIAVSLYDALVLFNMDAEEFESWYGTGPIIGL